MKAGRGKCPKCGTTINIPAAPQEKVATAIVPEPPPLPEPELAPEPTPAPEPVVEATFTPPHREPRYGARDAAENVPVAPIGPQSVSVVNQPLAVVSEFRPTVLGVVLFYLRAAIWGACFVWTCFCLGEHATNRGHIESAIQQAAIAAEAATWIIGGYVLSRSLDLVTRR